MKNRTVSSTFFLALFFVHGLNTVAQESNPARDVTFAITKFSAACGFEFIEIDRLKLRQRGIDLDLGELESLQTPVLLKNVNAFRSSIVAIEQRGYAERVFTPSMNILSGQTGAIKTTIGDRDFELHLTPQIISTGFKVDFKLKVIQPDVTTPGATRTRTIEFDCEGRLGDQIAMNVTKVFEDHSQNKIVILLLTIE